MPRPSDGSCPMSQGLTGRGGETDVATEPGGGRGAQGLWGHSEAKSRSAAYELRRSILRLNVAVPRCPHP